MNSQKVLSLVIGLFIICNILLGIGNYNKYIKVHRLSYERQIYIENILEEKGIELATPLPKWCFPMESIYLEPFEITNSLRDQMVMELLGGNESVTITKTKSDKLYGKDGRVYTKGQESLSFYDDYILYENKSVPQQEGSLSKKDALKVAKQFIKTLKNDYFFKNRKIYYKNESYGATLTYYEVYKGLPIFDNSVKISITGDKVFQVIFQSVSLAPEKTAKKEICPIDLVLFGISDELHDIENPSIVEITLGYGMQKTDSIRVVKEEAMPMYKIIVRGLDNPLFVNAYTNTIEYDIDYIVLLEK